MPMLMVLIKMAIMMPRLKYLLSTMPHSFILISYHSSLHPFFGLQQDSAPSWPCLSFPLVLDCTPSLSDSSTVPSSVSSLAAFRTGPTPSESASAAAHWGQPSVAEAAVRATGSADEAWPSLLWWGHGGPYKMQDGEIKGWSYKSNR